jgi:hypothetical protein
MYCTHGLECVFLLCAFLLQNQLRPSSLKTTNCAAEEKHEDKSGDLEQAGIPVWQRV